MIYILKCVVHLIVFYVKLPLIGTTDVILLHSQILRYYYYIIYWLFHFIVQFSFIVRIIWSVYSLCSKYSPSFKNLIFFLCIAHIILFSLKLMFWKTRSRNTFDFCKINNMIRYSGFTDKRTFFIGILFYSYL